MEILQTAGGTGFSVRGVVRKNLVRATSGNGLVGKTTDQSGNDIVLVFNSSGTQQQARRIYTAAFWLL